MNTLHTRLAVRDSKLLPFLPLALLLLLAGYAATWRTLFVQWSGAEYAGYNHGFLVLLCSCYLLYIKWPDFARHSPRPAALGLVPLGLCTLGWAVAGIMGVQSLQMVMLPAMLLCLVLTICGWAWFRLAFVPLSLLFFAIPIWQLTLPLLQDITTWVTHLNLRLIGRPVHVSGNFVHVSGGSFVIEEACSGLRFLLVGITLSLLNSELNRHSPRQYLGMLAMVVALAFIANWVRVLAVILIGDFTRMQSSIVDDHANFGWGIFLVCVLIPFFLVNRFMPLESDKADVDGEDTADHLTPEGGRSIPLAGIALLLVGPLLYWVAGDIGDVQSRPVIPQSVAGMVARTIPAATTAAWHPAYQNTSALLMQEYSGNPAVQLHLAFYARQSQDSELINSDNTLVDGSPWTVMPGSQNVRRLPAGYPVESVRVARIGNGQGSIKYLWYWYDIAGRSTISGVRAKLLQLLGLLSGRSDATLVVLASDCRDDCHNNADAHERFVEQFEIVVQ